MTDRTGDPTASPTRGDGDGTPHRPRPRPRFPRTARTAPDATRPLDAGPCTYARATRTQIHGDRLCRSATVAAAAMAGVATAWAAVGGRGCGRRWRAWHWRWPGEGGEGVDGGGMGDGVAARDDHVTLPLTPPLLPLLLPLPLLLLMMSANLAPCRSCSAWP